MSKKLSIIILLIIFSACSSLTHKRDILPGNVFHSTEPLNQGIALLEEGQYDRAIGDIVNSCV